MDAGRVLTPAAPRWDPGRMTTRPVERLLRAFALFAHEPVAIWRKDQMHAECSCGWRTMPIPPPFQFAVWDALAWHQKRVDEAIDRWQAARTEQVRGFADDVEAWMKDVG